MDSELRFSDIKFVNDDSYDPKQEFEDRSEGVVGPFFGGAVQQNEAELMSLYQAARENRKVGGAAIQNGEKILEAARNHTDKLDRVVRGGGTMPPVIMYMNEVTVPAIEKYAKSRGESDLKRKDFLRISKLIINDMKSSAGTKELSDAVKRRVKDVLDDPNMLRKYIEQHRNTPVEPKKPKKKRTKVQKGGYVPWDEYLQMQ